jgi:AcrR family transcriptional regulator
MTDYDSDKQRLLENAMLMFQRYGLKSVTMNDIAKELGISKKTVYKYVSNKEELVSSCCQFSLTGVSEKLLVFQSEAENAIDELFFVDSFMREKLETHLHSMEHQLQRHFPETHRQLTEKRQKLILDFQRRNLLRGIEEKLYRLDINTEVVAQLYYSKIHSLLTQSAHKPFIPNLKELLGQALEYHIHGIATPDGIAYLQQRLIESTTKP